MSSNPQDLTHLSVLAAFAHPDDEGFGFGGTMAMLAARGARVTLVCSTNGDVGEISDPALATPDNLYQVRQEELRQAMKVTGVEDVRFLGYRDSGMDGTPDNDHPRSLYQAPPDEVVAKMVDIIREVRPDLVFTHDPTGGYGHPDHITIHLRTARAFEVAGEVDALRGQLSGNHQQWAPKSLYYVCFPRKNFQRMWERMVELGIEPPFARLEAEKIGSPDEAVTNTIDVSPYVETKRASLACHRTQTDANGPVAKLPEDMMREIMSTEYFTLAVYQGDAAATDILAKLAGQE